MVILLIAPVHLRDGMAPDAAEVVPSRAQLTRSRGKRTEVAISVEDGLCGRSTHRLHQMNRFGINDVVSTVQATPSQRTGGLPDSLARRLDAPRDLRGIRRSAARAHSERRDDEDCCAGDRHRARVDDRLALVLAVAACSTDDFEPAGDPRQRADG